MSSSTCAVAANFAASSVVPRKSNRGFLTALRPSAALSAFTCARSCAPTTWANSAQLAVERAHLHRLGVERRLEVLERERVVEDRHVALGSAPAPAIAGAEQRAAADHAAAEQPGLGEERRAGVAGGRVRGLADRAVDVDVSRSGCSWSSFVTQPLMKPVAPTAALDLRLESGGSSAAGAG